MHRWKISVFGRLMALGVSALAARADEPVFYVRTLGQMTTGAEKADAVARAAKSLAVIAESAEPLGGSAGAAEFRRAVMVLLMEASGPTGMGLEAAVFDVQEGRAPALTRASFAFQFPGPAPGGVAAAEAALQRRGFIRLHSNFGQETPFVKHTASGVASVEFSTKCGPLIMTVGDGALARWSASVLCRESPILGLRCWPEIAALEAALGEPWGERAKVRGSTAVDLFINVNELRRCCPQSAGEGEVARMLTAFETPNLRGAGLRVWRVRPGENEAERVPGGGRLALQLAVSARSDPPDGARSMVVTAEQPAGGAPPKAVHGWSMSLRPPWATWVRTGIACYRASLEGDGAGEFSRALRGWEAGGGAEFVRKATSSMSATLLIEPARDRPGALVLRALLRDEGSDANWLAGVHGMTGPLIKGGSALRFDGPRRSWTYRGAPSLLCDQAAWTLVPAAARRDRRPMLVGILDLGGAWTDLEAALENAVNE